jgi:hypothetical protein
LFGKPEGKRPLWRHRYMWQDGVKIDVKDIDFEDVNGI